MNLLRAVGVIFLFLFFCAAMSGLWLLGGKHLQRDPEETNEETWE